jgi:hypothetical protein
MDNIENTENIEKVCVGCNNESKDHPKYKSSHLITCEVCGESVCDFCADVDVECICDDPFRKLPHKEQMARKEVAIKSLQDHISRLAEDLKFANKIKEERFAYRDMVIKQLNSEIFELKKENKSLTIEANKYFEIEKIVRKLYHPLVFY